MHFKSPSTAETNTNIAPLLDVVLLLLIFFMVTTSFAERQIPLDLPSAESGSPQDGESVVVSISAQGVYSVDDEAISEEGLTELLKTIALQELNLEIRADDAARHGYVVRILDLAKQARIERISIAVDKGK